MKSRAIATVDALSLAVFGNLFGSVAEEMGITLQRSAYSPNITMRRDFSCAIFDSQGRLLAQAAHIPVHLGAMPMAMQAVRERFDLAPGDVVILNDPFVGGTHLPDISLVSASFSDAGNLLGYVMSRAHHSDIGGMSPASMPLSTEIFQEGVVIPPLLLLKSGRLNDEVMKLLLRNVRTPIEREGDLRAQLAAQEIGERTLQQLETRYGIETLDVHGEALQKYAERMMQSLIRRIPTGTYSFVDHLDNDGLGTDAVRIQVAIRRDDDFLEIDFAGSSPQCLGPMNAVEAVTTSAALYVMRCLQAEDVPVNQGSLKPLRIKVPMSSVVCAQHPAAVVGGNVETSQRIVDVLFGALGQCLPDDAPAASQGTMNNMALGGFDSHRNRHFAYYETLGGGQGAIRGLSGANAVHDHMSNTLNTPVEVLESEFPVKVRRYQLRDHTGGEGAWRGGDGLIREIEVLQPVTATVISERRIFPPYGLHLGMPGMRGENTLIRKGKQRPLPGKFTMSLEPGDSLTISTPGGGGAG